MVVFLNVTREAFVPSQHGRQRVELFVGRLPQAMTHDLAGQPVELGQRSVAVNLA